MPDISVNGVRRLRKNLIKKFRAECWKCRMYSCIVYGQQVCALHNAELDGRCKKMARRIEKMNLHQDGNEQVAE